MRHPLWISLFAVCGNIYPIGYVAAIRVRPGLRQPHGQRPCDGPSGSSLEVTLGTRLSSETASVGDAWTGSVVNGPDGVPAGSGVSGTVRAVRRPGRAIGMLDLPADSITVDGR